MYLLEFNFLFNSNIIKGVVKGDICSSSYNVIKPTYGYLRMFIRHDYVHND